MSTIPAPGHEQPAEPPQTTPIPYVGAPRTVPHAQEAEEAVLAAILFDNEVPALLDGFLLPEHFYHPMHARIYTAVQALVQQQRPVDAITIIQQMRDSGSPDPTGDQAFVARLSLMLGSSAHVVDHAKIVIEKWLLRQLIKASNEITHEAYGIQKDVQDVLELAEEKVFAISQSTMRREVVDMPTVLNQTLKGLQEAAANTDQLHGVSTGFPCIDEMTGGWQKGELIIIAARPGVGKTAFVLTAAHNAARRGARVAFFSLEMPNEQLAMRLLAGETGIDQKQLRSGRLTDQQWNTLAEVSLVLAEDQIFFDDTPAIGPGELRSKCRKLKSRHDIDLVVVDYLQLMTAPQQRQVGNREQEISKISGALKALAKELNIPVIALAQLNRSVETRTDPMKRMQLSDLRESGAIEQDADVVAFVHRPEYHKIQAYPDGTSTAGMAEFRIEKNRNGVTGVVYLSFIPHQVKFVDNQPQVDHYQRDVEGLGPSGGAYVNSDGGAKIPQAAPLPSVATTVLASRHSNLTAPNADIPPLDNLIGQDTKADF